MKKIIALLCALAMLLTFAACAANTEESKPDADPAQTAQDTPAAETSQEPAQNVTLRFSWWGSDSRHEATLAAIALYESRHPGVKIEAEYGGADGYKDKRMTEMAGGNAPDIMQIDSPWLYDMQTQFEAFADLGQFSEQIDTSGFDADFVAAHGGLDGTIYGLPTGINATYMLMNTALMDAAGVDSTQAWTWDSVLTDGAKIHEANSEAYFLNLDQHSLYYHVVRPYIKQLTGNQFMNEDYTIGFSEEDLAQALDYIRQLFENGVMQPASESFMYIDAFYDNPIWVNNQVAVDIDWSSSLSARKAGFADSAAVTSVPQMNGAKDSGILVRPAQILCISNTSEHQKEAAEFINFFFNDPDAIAILKMERSVPATEAAREQLAQAGELDALVNQAVNAALASAGAVENTVSQNMQLENILVDAVEKVGYGLASPEEVAAETYELLQAKLEELKAS